MQLPFFYIENYDGHQKEITLDENTSRHVVQVLRMKKGEKLNLTDGKGTLLTASIIDAHKKHCLVNVESTRHREQGTRKVFVGISLLKNTDRFEWFLEKATEIGISEIIPLICERTIKEKFRYDRMKEICISAMLQSQQVWLPVLHEPIAFDLLFRQEEMAAIEQKFIAHCDEGNKKQLNHQAIKQSTIILIGPEGDFSPKEIELALSNHFIPVSLGETRLRTETAGVVAATLLQIV